MAGLTDAGRDAALAGFTAEAVRASLHTADPGDAGGSEVSGGGYVRASLSWGDPDAGEVRSAVALSWDVPAGVTVTHMGYWAAGGVFLGSRPLGQRESFASPGTFTVAAGAVSEGMI